MTWNFVTLRRGIFQKPAANIMLYGELQVTLHSSIFWESPLRSGTRPGRSWVLFNIILTALVKTITYKNKLGDSIIGKKDIKLLFAVNIITN